MAGTETQRFSWRRVGPLLGLIAVAAVIIVVVALVAGGGDDTKPIGEQSCSELVATLRDIQHDEAPSESTSTQADATKRAGELNTRVDALGGCPSEPALQ